MACAFEKIYDLIISGAGIPGASLALGAARQGLCVALIDPRPRLMGTGDTRTTALLPESLNFLDTLDLLSGVLPQAQPLYEMILKDDRGHRRDQPRRLNFKGPENRPLAYNIANQVLSAKQQTALEHAAPQIDCYWGQQLTHARVDRGQALVNLESGLALRAHLAIAADGRKSPLRKSLHIKWQGLSRHQIALTARLRHRAPHQGVCTEFHRYGGPMTFVPFIGDGHDTALVWSMTTALAEQVRALDDRAFSRRVQIASRGVLGELGAVSHRAAFPVRPGFARQLALGPFALIAEAAHTLPPLLAQGLNLSLSDVRILLACLDQYGPGPQCAKAYAAKRWPDLMARLGIAEGLNKILTQAPMPLSLTYDLGRMGLQGLAPLRRAAVRVGQRGQQTVVGLGA